MGVLDSGVWPEHPSFADQGNLAAPPPKADGTPRSCDFGDNPLTPADDPFACNNKLIGGAGVPRRPYLANPDRCGGGAVPHRPRLERARHAHRRSTAPANVVAPRTVFGVERGPIQGIAPGAWVSVYKVCGIEGCFASDSAAAVEQAILDGVDVINFSVSGGVRAVQRSGRARVPRRVRGGCVRRRLGGQRGPGRRTLRITVSPWVTSVAASTQTRDVPVDADAVEQPTARRPSFAGASITAGAGPAPVVMASAAPYADPLCDEPPPRRRRSPARSSPASAAAIPRSKRA